jgi:hypothetical protein
MPQMLEALRGSVSRTAEVLSQLVWHATNRSKVRTPARPKLSSLLDKPEED